MRKLFVFKAIVLAIVFATVSSFSTQARLLRVGPRVGVEVNKLHFNEKIFEGENNAGFTAGLQLDIVAPLGIGADLSVMYVRRSAEFMRNNTDVTDVDRDYIHIPLNFKYRLGLPLVDKIIAPYLFTGPDFAFLTSGTGINDAWKSKKFSVAWNVGLGVELIKHLQVSATYGIGISKAAEAIGITEGAQEINGKNRYWTVTAAWLF
ncbi:MAG: porin family protein [Muribaculaceae bacterium]